MGYCSDLVIRTTNPEFVEKFHDYLIEERCAHYKRTVFDEDDYTVQHTYIMHSVKWYSDDERTIEIEDFVCDHHNDSALIRLGEDEGDNEYIGSPYELGLSLERYIGVDNFSSYEVVGE